jgi:hypothetical protein
MPKDSQMVEGEGIPVRSHGQRREVIDLAEFDRYFDLADDLVKGESDRAKVLILAEVIEAELVEVIRSFLVSTNQKSDQLLDVALKDFGDRIDLAYRLGLISHPFWRDLHIICELKNDCVDRMESFDFEHGAIESSIMLLVRSVSRHNFAARPLQRMNMGERFVHVAKLCLAMLQAMSYTSKRLKEADKERIYQDLEG